MNDIFKLRGKQTYNLRKLFQFYRPKVNSVYNGTERVSFLGPKIWDLVPNELKDIGNLAAFKKATKSGHQRNVLVGFVKIILEMSVWFKKRGRLEIFPVQKTRKYNRVSNITIKWLLTCQILTSNSFQDCVMHWHSWNEKKEFCHGLLISFNPLLLRYCFVFCFWCLILF